MQIDTIALQIGLQIDYMQPDIGCIALLCLGVMQHAIAPSSNRE